MKGVLTMKMQSRAVACSDFQPSQLVEGSFSIIRKTLIVIVPAAILFLAAPAHSHGGEEGGEEHSTPELVVPVVEESHHSGEDHHAHDTVESEMEEQADHHGAQQRLEGYMSEESNQAALNKAKAEAAEQKAMQETEKLKYRAAAAVFGIFILIIGLVLRYAPGRAER